MSTIRLNVRKHIQEAHLILQAARGLQRTQLAANRTNMRKHIQEVHLIPKAAQGLQSVRLAANQMSVKKHIQEVTKPTKDSFNSKLPECERTHTGSSSDSTGCAGPTKASLRCKSCEYSTLQSEGYTGPTKKSFVCKLPAC